MGIQKKDIFHFILRVRTLNLTMGSFVGSSLVRKMRWALHRNLHSASFDNGFLVKKGLREQKVAKSNKGAILANNLDATKTRDSNFYQSAP